MEVFTQEIHGFKKSVEKLEAMAKRLEGSNKRTDNSGLDFLIQNFIRNQKETLLTLENRIGETHSRIDKSRWTPKWEMIMLYAVLCINTTAFGYLGYYFIQYENNKKITVSKGREEGIGKAKAYFEDHPIIAKDFQKWSAKQDSVPNLK